MASGFTVLACSLVLLVPASAASSWPRAGARAAADVGSGRGDDAEPGHPSRPLRPLSAEARDLVDLGIACSGTVADLTEALTGLGVLVDVEVIRTFSWMDRTFVASGRTVLLTAGPPVRYLRVQISRTRDARKAVSLLAHELQHALEVANAPEVRDQADMRQLFARIGRSGRDRNTFETDAAFEAGQRTQREVTTACLEAAANGKPGSEP